MLPHFLHQAMTVVMIMTMMTEVMMTATTTVTMTVMTTVAMLTRTMIQTIPAVQTGIINKKESARILKWRGRFFMYKIYIFYK